MIIDPAKEWGLPNWRDAAAYGDIERWGFNRWRWEFFRRRDDLRACFDAHAEASYNRWQSYFNSKPGSIQRAWWMVYAKQIGRVSEPPRPSDVGFVAFVEPEDIARFGYYRLPNPRISEQIEIVIAPDEDDGTVSVVFGNNCRTFQEILDRYCEPLTRRQLAMLGENASFVPVPINEGGVAVVFDLSKPLVPQLSVVKKNLLEAQSKLFGKPLQKRRHPAKWFGYLRTLDAREDGASWSEIAALHPNTAQTEQAARDAWEQASALRFNF